MYPVRWLWKKKKGFGLSKACARGNFSVSPTWSTRPPTGCWAGSTSFWVHRNIFWQLSRDGNWHGSGMSQPFHNHPSLHFGGWATPWSPEEMLDGQHQRVDSPAHARAAHEVLPQKRRSLLNRRSCPPDDPVGQGTELNWTFSCRIAMRNSLWNRWNGKYCSKICVSWTFKLLMGLTLGRCNADRATLCWWGTTPRRKK